MSASIDELVDRIPPADQFEALMKLAHRILDRQGKDGPVPLATDNNLPIGYLFRVPPMPESDLTPEEQAAEDARRMATLDDAVTLDEMLELLDFGAAAAEGQRS
jgi:hypothetical protein